MTEPVRFGELAGVLAVPAGATACVVLGHGFSATVASGLAFYVERFAAAGFAALAFDYRSFGASGGLPREVLSVPAQLTDWASAVAYARTVAPAVALWGTSYGGGHVLEVAARDSGVAAVVAQVPFVSGPATLRTFRTATALSMLAAGAVDRLGARLGAPPLYLPTARRSGDPRRPSLADLDPDGRHRVAARAFLELRGYLPGRAAASVGCPLLVQVAEHDEITPAPPARAAARAAPRGELVQYPGRHFDVYVGAGRDRAVADQIAFLDRSLRS